MRLSDFIRRHSEEISKEWEDFARTCEPAAARMNVEQLRDHILPLLHFLAEDIEEPQTEFEQHEKAQGRQPRADPEASQAEVHAALRVIDRFTVDQVVAEYRALRASILRLWAKQRPTETELTQIIRFNESIDQMLGESVARHAELEATARQNSKRRDAFLATLSHELRGPLGALSNGVQIVAASGAANPTLAPVAAMMVRQTRHLHRLLNDLLDLARISRDRLSLQLAPTDIRDCIQDAVDANREQLTQKAHVLKVDIPEAPLLAEVDSTRIVQMMSNLLNNAAKHSPAGSKIEISLTCDKDQALISVRDDGIGIDPELLPRVFDAFYVNHETNLSKSGLGIGLWLSRRLVEMHGGTIVAKSEGPGRGAEFCATIPLRLTASRTASSQENG